MADWTFHEGEIDRPDVRELLAQHFTEMRGGSPPSACHVLEPDALRDPAIRFVTLRESGTLLACGALKRLASDHGEIKSMRTANSALGRGVGRAMLSHLTEIARSGGMTRLSLETGNSALFAAANRLYRSAGFVPCGPFAGYRPTEFTTFYTRAI